jgi:Capsule assembly protein Wzi
MRKENWVLVFAGTVALGIAVTPLSAQEISHPHTLEATSQPPAESVTVERRSQPRKRVGSPYVELDSWIYPVFERLTALGYIHSEFSDMRPWTRVECARMVQEAGKVLDVDPNGSSEAQRFYTTLRNEFQPELGELKGGEEERTLRLESLYSRVTGISGQPLNDSYHFGQTITNNYGRPYHEGLNSYAGFSGYAVAGRFVIYTRGEFQHAPSAPAYPLSARQGIATADGNPLLPAAPIAGVDQFRLLDAYAGVDVAGWDIAIGKQSLWWAPNHGGALLFSDNAEPIYMARMSRVAPFKLPWIFRLLGPMKWDLFVGKLSGDHYPARPLVHGEKISFKPTKNLELSFSRTAEFGGVGRPLTMGAIWHTYTSFQSSVDYPASQNPGERNGGFDFSYRIPRLRNWVTVYGDLASRDDPNPLDAPRRAAWNPGLYLAWIPYVPRLDFRVEAVNTNPPSTSTRGGQFFYWEGHYHDLYVNKGNLIGDWIGREGTGFQAWSTYWFNPRNTIQLGYRHAKVSGDFIPYGETLNDGSVTLNWWLHDSVQFSALVQYEKWLAPVLAASPQTNWTSSVEITLWPKSLKR